MINTYTALDIETTGLNPATDKIIEIGMAKVIEGEIVSEYSCLINPQIPINYRIQELTGINDAMVAASPSISEVISDIIEFAGDVPILGHNVIFDFSFIKKAAVDNRLTFAKDGIDTLKMARRILPDLEHRRLEFLCEYFAINPGNSHRALDDAISAMKIYEKLYQISPEDSGFEKAVELNYNVKRDTPITPAQTSYLSSLIRQHSIEMEADVKSLTKSQASRMIDNILSSYGKAL